MRRARLFFLLLVALAVGQLAWYFPRMPAVMATHYDGAGVPNGSMTRSMAAVVQIALLGVLGGVFLFLPISLGRVSSARLKVPHREYWLAPERRKETVLAIQERVSLLGTGLLGLLLLVNEFNYRANLNPPLRLPAAALFAIPAGYGLFFVAWMISFLRRFHRPKGG
jgi:uncharacterized membrane protein